VEEVTAPAGWKERFGGAAPTAPRVRVVMGVGSVRTQAAFWRAWHTPTTRTSKQADQRDKNTAKGMAGSS
jgi:hypothetical protein